jgi:hypothetical protein
LVLDAKLCPDRLGADRDRVLDHAGDVLRAPEHVHDIHRFGELA